MERIAEKEEGEPRSRPRWPPRAPSWRREPLAEEDLGDESDADEGEDEDEDDEGDGADGDAET